MPVTDYCCLFCCFVLVLSGNGNYVPVLKFFPAMFPNGIASRVADTDLRSSAPFSFELPFSDPYSVLQIRFCIYALKCPSILKTEDQLNKSILKISFTNLFLFFIMRTPLDTEQK